MICCFLSNILHDAFFLNTLCDFIKTTHLLLVSKAIQYPGFYKIHDFVSCRLFSGLPWFTHLASSCSSNTTQSFVNACYLCLEWSLPKYPHPTPLSILCLNDTLQVSSTLNTLTNCSPAVYSDAPELQV